MLRKKGSAVVIHALLIAICIMMNLPFIWMLSTSFKSKNETFAYPPKLIPEKLRWENYVAAWNAIPFGRFMFNSMFVSTMVTIGQLLICTLAAYAFAWIPFKGKDFLFYAFLGTMMVPFEMLVIPNYVMIRKLGWTDTYIALIVPFLASAFTIFLLRQAFMTIPSELYDAAVIDGCSHTRYLYGIIVPLSKPAMLTAGMFTFLGHWNDYLWPLIVTNRPEYRTVQVGLTMFQSAWQTEWTHLMAASAIVTVPIIVLYIFVQKNFVEGIATTGIKG